MERPRLDESDFRESVALCPNCSAVFKAGMFVQFRNGHGFEILEMPELFGTFYCPNCSYPIGSTKNSLYDFVEDTFKVLRDLGKPELFFLEEAFSVFNNSFKQQKDQDELKRKINEVAPKLFTLNRFVPANSGEWAAWFSLVATIVFGLISFIQGGDSDKAKIILNNVGNTTVVYPKVMPSNSSKTVKRNDQCPCGSGKKFKMCHGLRNKTKD